MRVVSNREARRTILAVDSEIIVCFIIITMITVVTAAPNLVAYQTGDDNPPAGRSRKAARLSGSDQRAIWMELIEHGPSRWRTIADIFSYLYDARLFYPIEVLKIFKDNISYSLGSWFSGGLHIVFLRQSASCHEATPAS